jgi:hypothetical protein
MIGMVSAEPATASGGGTVGEVVLVALKLEHARYLPSQLDQILMTHTSYLELRLVDSCHRTKRRTHARLNRRRRNQR